MLFHIILSNLRILLFIYSSVDNPQEPLILKVKEKDDILGVVVVPLAELPTRRSDRQKWVLWS